MNKKRTLVIITISLGWLASGYLFFRSSQLNKGLVDQFNFCKFLFGSSCDEALLASASWQLGINMASVGLMYFGLLGLLIVVRKKAFNIAALLISAIGFGVSITLGATLYSKEIPCPLCQGVHLINLLSFLLIFITVAPHKKTNGQKQTASLWPSIKWVFILLLTVFAGIFSETYILANSIGTRTEVSQSQTYKNFQTGIVYNFSKKGQSPMSGSPSAPLQLIVFSSFQCPGCQIFNASLAHIKNKFAAAINIEYKNYPLSSNCNPLLKENMQPHSCQAALAAIAANSQGLYWKYHEELFKTNLQADSGTLQSVANTVGLNIEKWETDRKSESSKELLMADIKLGNEVGINATPSVFLNGRRITAIHESSVTYLLQQELNRLSK